PLPCRPVEVRRHHSVFFSSRRRHTRSKRDWSSDVCSSDLFASGTSPTKVRASSTCPPPYCTKSSHARSSEYSTIAGSTPRSKRQIGRASCRERVASEGEAAAVGREGDDESASDRLHRRDLI